MELPIQLIVKVQQFDDKRIEAKASWNIKELKGKLSEIYATVRNFVAKKISEDSKKSSKAVLCRQTSEIIV